MTETEPVPRGVLVAFVGAGLIGKAVLDLFSTALSQRTFTIISISNSKYTVSQPHSASPPLSGSALLALLPSSSSPTPPSSPKDITYSSANPSALISTLASLRSSTGLPVLLIDCTASLPLCNLYSTILSSSISIVTPNKKAFSSSHALWEEINLAQRGEGAGWVFHEATVGAGLPVVATLRDLVVTGDEVVKIEGITSGTLSAVFNTFSRPGGKGAGNVKFSEAVRMAREEGLTEPNPAEDLAGQDVARKLTILARLSAQSPPSSLSKPLPLLPKGYESIETQSLIPPALNSITDGDEFVSRLADHDAEFDKLREEAEAANEVIRYVGRIEKDTGVIKCGLQRYPSTHPFATLAGSDNSVAIYTRRYFDSPLIVQGPADHTAAGVLGDAYKVAERAGLGPFL
ncbi:hypothetical protein RQP46_004289 [Phenoliferia psychrophenolica]